MASVLEESSKKGSETCPSGNVDPDFATWGVIDVLALGPVPGVSPVAMLQHRCGLDRHTGEGTRPPSGGKFPGRKERVLKGGCQN